MKNPALMRQLLILFVIFNWTNLYAQELVETTYLSKKNERVVVKDSAYYCSKKYDFDKTQYLVKLFTMDEKLMEQKYTNKETLKEVGLKTVFYPSGNRKFEGSMDGSRIGVWTFWYENGNLGKQINYGNEQNSTYLIVSYWDEAGNQKVKNGNGEFEYFDFENCKCEVHVLGQETSARGKVVRGKEEGVWVGTFRSGTLKYVEKYKSGKLVEGKSYDEMGSENKYTFIYEMPEFAAGHEKMYKIISKSLKYPSDAAKDKIEGTVFIFLIVEIDGTISDISVAKSIYPSLDEEALKAVAKLTKWTVAKERGQAIKIKTMVPIKFLLN